LSTKKPLLNEAGAHIFGSAENAVVGNGPLERRMHVLTKPFSMEVLAQRIRAILSA
jgi:hypothetical protein